MPANNKRKSSARKSSHKTILSFQSNILRQPVNDDSWACCVAMIVERTPPYKNYIKCFEEAAKLGNRPVIKNISIKDVEANEGAGKPSSKMKPDPGNPEIPRARLTAEKIKRIIMKTKEEDVFLRDSVKREVENCVEKASEMNSRNMLDKIDLDIVQDEPICGPSIYFVLTGFYDPQLTIELLNLRIPLNVIFAFDEKENFSDRDEINQLRRKSSRKKETIKITGKQDNYETFWFGYDQLVKTKEMSELTSGVIVFPCDPKEILLGKEEKQKDINNLIYNFTIQKLYDVQTDLRKHVHFIRNIKEIPIEQVKRIHIRDMEHYYNLVRLFPLEVVTIDYILYCLVQEVEVGREADFRQRERADLQRMSKQIDSSIQSSHLGSCGSCELIKTEKENLTPLILDHWDLRGLRLRNHVNFNEMIKEHFMNILENSPCSILWRIFPPASREERLFNLSHYHKIRHFMRLSNKEMLEASIHKEVFNKIILSSFDPRNIDSMCCEYEFFEDSEEEDVEGKLNTSCSFNSLKKEESETSINIDEVIKNSKALTDLKHFLNYPEIDNLYMKCFDVIENYHTFDILKKETALQVLNLYHSIYYYVDYVYYRPTDSILLVFHHGKDNDALIRQENVGNLLTPVGFRDYYNVIFKKHKYRSWILSQDEVINKIDSDLLKRFKIVPGEEEAEKCCFRKIKKYGLFSRGGTKSEKSYQNHLPHPEKRTAGEGEPFNFIGYNLESSCSLRYNEKSTVYISKNGTRIASKTYNSFNSSDIITSINFNYSGNKLFFEFAQQEYLNDQLQKVSFETSDEIRLTFTHMRSNFQKFTYFEREKVDAKNARKKTKPSVHITEENVKEIKNTVIAVLPTGLEISTNTLNNEILGIKQRYLDFRHSQQSDEKYRICMKDGSVMVFTDKGNIIVYYPNTTVTDIKRVSAERSFKDVCGAGKEKRDTTLISGKYERNDRNPSLAMRSKSIAQGIDLKKQESYHVIGEHEVVTWSGLKKYFKYDFNFKSDYSYKLRAAYEEGTTLYTSRSDGTKSILNGEGMLAVQYPDGTRISSIPLIQQLLLPIETDDDDVNSSIKYDEMWTCVELEFTMEEPNNYVPVRYYKNMWTIFLPGNKTISFYDEKQISLTLSNYELTYSQVDGTIQFRPIKQEIDPMNNLNILLSRYDDGTVCQYTDEYNSLTINCKGEMSMPEKCHKNRRQQGEEGVTDLHNLQGRDSSFYIIRPTEVETDYKMFILKRDLSGCELFEESESGYNRKRTTLNSVNVEKGDIYKDKHCDVTLTRHEPEIESIPPLYYKVPYLNQYCFSTTKLARSDLSDFLPKETVWLFSPTDQTTKSPSLTSNMSQLSETQYFHILNQEQPKQPRLSIVNKPHNKRALITVRRLFDINQIENLSEKFKNALKLYLNYKKNIFFSILKNTLNGIKIKQKFNINSQSNINVSEENANGEVCDEL